MKMKFKIDSLYRVKGIALRYVCLGLSFLCLLLYFLLGATSSKLSPITGTVKDIHVSYQKKIGVLKLNIELINYRNTIFQQEYYIDIPAEIIWGIDKNHLLNLPLRGNDKITIYYDPNGNIRKLKSDKIGLKTYGLIINNNEIIDVNKRKYLTFKTSMLGTISFLLIIISFLSLIIDISTLSKKKKANSNISFSNEELYKKFNISEKCQKYC